MRSLRGREETPTARSGRIAASEKAIRVGATVCDIAKAYVSTDSHQKRVKNFFGLMDSARKFFVSKWSDCNCKRMIESHELIRYSHSEIIPHRALLGDTEPSTYDFPTLWKKKGYTRNLRPKDHQNQWT